MPYPHSQQKNHSYLIVCNSITSFVILYILKLNKYYKKNEVVVAEKSALQAKFTVDMSSKNLALIRNRTNSELSRDDDVTLLFTCRRRNR